MSHNNESAEELQDKLDNLKGDFVALQTEGGQIWYGYVGDVEDGLVKLKYVEAYTPACPCETIWWFDRAWVVINQITGILYDFAFAVGAASTPFMETVERIQQRAADAAAAEASAEAEVASTQQVIDKLENSKVIA
ncbi:hypothetical protein [Niallia endozanthoxylica]|uniref:Uncharacterized protein n=1 Tax=Niallia endozanthoxylica TaxID=2036016 RepID=A0A5J5I8B0_9BACI|nr:hypothetical protein [Niallia endozanthoxylica]KAA9030684.1 hypothetical protein F4V44_02535 [Niallia endozanthoxylica]